MTEANEFIWAEIDYVSQASVRINHRYCFILHCSFISDEGELITMKSGLLEFDPTEILSEGLVKVWINKSNLQEYYVDVEISIFEAKKHRSKREVQDRFDFR